MQRELNALFKLGNRSLVSVPLPLKSVDGNVTLTWSSGAKRKAGDERRRTGMFSKDTVDRKNEREESARCLFSFRFLLERQWRTS